jgi:hypothetical protein
MANTIPTAPPIIPPMRAPPIDQKRRSRHSISWHPRVATLPTQAPMNHPLAPPRTAPASPSVMQKSALRIKRAWMRGACAYRLRAKRSRNPCIARR